MRSRSPTSQHPGRRSWRSRRHHLPRLNRCPIYASDAYAITSGGLLPHRFFPEVLFRQAQGEGTIPGLSQCLFVVTLHQVESATRLSTISRAYPVLLRPILTLYLSSSAWCRSSFHGYVAIGRCEREREQQVGRHGQSRGILGVELYRCDAKKTLSESIHGLNEEICHENRVSNIVEIPTRACEGAPYFIHQQLAFVSHQDSI